MQLGAEHVVAKPLDLNHLAVVTARVCDKVRLMRQNVLLREALEQLLSTPRPMQLDGEPWGDAPFEARLLPAALPVIVDPATAPLGASRRG